MGTNRVMGNSTKLIIIQVVFFVTFSVFGHEFLPNQIEIDEMMFLDRNQGVDIRSQTENTQRIQDEEQKEKLELAAVTAAIWNQWFLGQQLRRQLYNDRKDYKGDITKRNSELTSTFIGIPRTIIDRYHRISSTSGMLSAKGTSNVKHQMTQ